MSGRDWTQLPPGEINVRRLSLLLQKNGWEVAGGRADLYSRYRLPETPQAEIIVPLNPQMLDYNELLTDALVRLANSVPVAGLRAVNVLDALDAPPGDEVKFRKMARTISGAVAWSTGEDLIRAAREALVAGAKARLSKQAYYGNMSGQFAARFLDSVLMGQTEVGSYIVTAYAPPTRMFPERTSKDPASPPLPDVAAFSGRQIIETFASALAVTREAIQDYNRNASLDVFVEAVPSGVSRELVSALELLTTDSDGAQVTVDWTPEVQRLGSDGTEQSDSVSVEFAPADTDVLRRAARHLAVTEPSTPVRVVGDVKVVSRPNRGGVGVVSMRVLRGSDAATLRIRLNEEDFQVAAEAIRTQQLLTVSGRQEREGRSHWLYDVFGVELAEPLDPEPKGRVKPNPHMPGQGSF